MLLDVAGNRRAGRANQKNFYDFKSMFHERHRELWAGPAGNSPRNPMALEERVQVFASTGDLIAVAYVVFCVPVKWHRKLGP